VSWPTKERLGNKLNGIFISGANNKVSKTSFPARVGGIRIEQVDANAGKDQQTDEVTSLAQLKTVRFPSAILRHNSETAHQMNQIIADLILIKRQMLFRHTTLEFVSHNKRWKIKLLSKNSSRVTLLGQCGKGQPIGKHTGVYLGAVRVRTRQREM